MSDSNSMEERPKRNRNLSLEHANRAPGSKRGSTHTMAKETSNPESPFIPMFEHFRTELDEHHDRRERVIKASRDVTANSKKVIFSLQRFPLSSLSQSVPANIETSIAPLLSTISSLLSSLVSDLSDINTWRYQRQVSPGLQEFVEAVAFRHYLTTQTLISHAEAQKLLPDGILLTQEDYILGVFDTVGEMMRWSITGIATSGTLPGTGNKILHPPASGAESEKSDAVGNSRDVVVDLRELRVYLEGVKTRGSGLGWEFDKKLNVMQTCVEKVENAAYGLAIRGGERPKGWVPEEKDKRVEVEGY